MKRISYHETYYFSDVTCRETILDGPGTMPNEFIRIDAIIQVGEMKNVRALLSERRRNSWIWRSFFDIRELNSIPNPNVRIQ